VTINVTEVDEGIVLPPATDPAEEDDGDDAETESEGETEQVITLQADATTLVPQAAAQQDSRASAPQAVAVAAPIIVSSDASGVESGIHHSELAFSTTIGGFLPQQSGPAIRLMNEVAPKLVAYIDPQLFWQKMDDFQEGLREEYEADLTSGTIAITALAMTAGYTFLTVKEGYLLAGVVSHLPAWQATDSLPIFDAAVGDWET
jgi:hypothetical protein